MANVLTGNNCRVAKQTISFAALGFDATNIAIIYDVAGIVTKSYRPDRPVNAVTGFVAGRAYYIIAKVDLNLDDYLATPLPTGNDGGFFINGAPLQIN